MKWAVSIKAGFIWCIVFWLNQAGAQSIGSYLPDPIIKSDKFLFYLHGQVVTELGNNAINQAAPEWGPYEYLNILDSLRRRGFNVISEIRLKGIDNQFYVDKISSQIDSLLRGGVHSEQIIVLGASAGWDITLRVSSQLKNSLIRYVIMGGCWPQTYKDYEQLALYGRFLSIIEKSDPHGTCYKIFERPVKTFTFKEITLNTGLSHGFICKGDRAWIDPVVEFFLGK